MVDSLYTDPAVYRMLFDERRHDLPFYLELASGVAGPVLELGVGTGRVALPLCRVGHRVVGVDSSADMLAALAERVSAEPPEVRDRLTWLRADGRSVELARRFDLVICPFNGLAHQHTDGELRALLGNVARHLTSDGLFAFDVTVPDPGLLAGASSSIPWFRHPRSGEVCRCDETARYDPVTRVLTFVATIRWMESERAPQTLRWQLRQLSPEETPALLEESGFEVVRRDSGLVDAIGYVCGVAGSQRCVSSG